MEIQQNSEIPLLIFLKMVYHNCDVENNGICSFHSRRVKLFMNNCVECRKIKGSFTVEASIIVPIMILSIAAVIYTGLLLYQRTIIQSAAESAAADGAAAWSSGMGRIGTGKVSGNSFDKIKLYRRIYDRDKEQRLEIIRSHAEALAVRGELLKPVETVIQAQITDYAVCRKLEVTITKSYILPLGGFLKIFGGSKEIVISVKASSMLDEPVELIRNTDFVLDLERQLEENNPDIKNMGDKTRNAMNNLKTRLEKFLN